MMSGKMSLAAGLSVALALAMCGLAAAAGAPDIVVDGFSVGPITLMARERGDWKVDFRRETEGGESSVVFHVVRPHVAVAFRRKLENPCSIGAQLGSDVGAYGPFVSFIIEIFEPGVFLIDYVRIIPGVELYRPVPELFVTEEVYCLPGVSMAGYPVIVGVCHDAARPCELLEIAAA